MLNVYSARASLLLGMLIASFAFAENTQAEVSAPHKEVEVQSPYELIMPMRERAETIDKLLNDNLSKRTY